MKVRTSLFLVAALFYFDSVTIQASMDYDDIDDCVEENLNNLDDRLIAKDRLHDRCDDLKEAAYDRCASVVVDSFVDNGRFGIEQGNNLLDCLVGHNINAYNFDADTKGTAYSGVLQAVGVTSVSDIDLSFIVDDDILKDTTEELEKCEDECSDKNDFFICCRDWVADIRDEIKYWEEYRIIGACRDSDVCARRRNLRA